jgi:hypothetical protein
LTMRPSSTLTVRLHVSGQSKVQTLARSSRAIIVILVGICGGSKRARPGRIDRKQPGIPRL